MNRTAEYQTGSPSASNQFTSDEILNLNRNEKEKKKNFVQIIAAPATTEFLYMNAVRHVHYEILNIYYCRWKSAPHIHSIGELASKEADWLRMNEIKITAMLAVARSVYRRPYGARSIERYSMFVRQHRCGWIGRFALPKLHILRSHFFIFRTQSTPAAGQKKGKKWRMKYVMPSVWHRRRPSYADTLTHAHNTAHRIFMSQSQRKIGFHAEFYRFFLFLSLCRHIIFAHVSSLVLPLPKSIWRLACNVDCRCRIAPTWECTNGKRASTSDEDTLLWRHYAGDACVCIGKW